MVKSTNGQYLSPEAENEILYFLDLQKFEKIKGSYVLHLWPLGRDIDE